MAVKIAKKITKYRVDKSEAPAAEPAPAPAAAAPAPAAPAAAPPTKAEVIRMHESVDRPDMLIGST
ncbi:MAG: NrdJb, partial [Pseudomonadota bacterium]